MSKETIMDVPITLTEEGVKKMEEMEEMEEMAKRHPGMTPQQLLDEMVKEKKAQNK